MKRSFYLVAFVLTFILFSCNQQNKNESQDSSSVVSAMDLVPMTKEQKMKYRICTELLSPKHKIDSSKAAFGDPVLFWPSSYKMLKIQFLDGDPGIQQKVLNSAKKWEEHAGLKFEFGVFEKPDISISFKHPGSWSYIGTDSKDFSPSMNFGWFDENTSDAEYDRVVLHEFGHAVGLYHEHESPFNNPIKWNKKLVYEYYMGPPNNWSIDQINNNLFGRYEREKVNGTQFDIKSIMLYPVPSDFTSDGFETGSNNQLSLNDTRFIKTIYPITKH